jgi:hypothetical protein
MRQIFNIINTKNKIVNDKFFDTKIDLQKTPKEVYFLIIESNNHKVVKKIIKN